MALVGRDAADGAGRVEADPEGRREQPDAHGEDDHHRIVHLVHADRARHGEQQRAEQHDRGNALEHAAEHDEGDDRDGEEARAVRRAPAAIMVTSWREKPDWVSAQAIAVAVPMMSRMAPESDAVSISIG